LVATAAERSPELSDAIRTRATKLNLKDALVWIDRELNGYGDVKLEDLPPYRRLTGIPQGYIPFMGGSQFSSRTQKLQPIGPWLISV
jgi:hypothetical protein